MKIVYPMTNGFVYPYAVETMKDIKPYPEELFDLIGDSIEKCYAAFAYHIDLSDQKIFEQDEYIQKVMLKRMNKALEIIKKRHHMVFCFNMKDGSILFKVDTLKDDLFMFVITIFKDGVSRIYPTIIVDADKVALVDYRSTNPLYYSTKSSKATAVAKADEVMFDEDDNTISYGTNVMNIMSFCMKYMAKYEEYEFIPVVWSPDEMDLIRAFVKSRKAKDGNLFVLSVISDNDLDKVKRGLTFKSKIKSKINPEIDRSKIPLIDLTEKEWKFIDKYIKNNFSGKEFDLVPYFNNHIGKDMKFIVSYLDAPINVYEGERPIYVNIDIDAEADVMRILLIDPMSKKSTFVISVDFIDISKFKFDNIVSIVKYTYYLNLNDMHNSLDQLAQRTPAVLMMQDYIVEMVRRIIALSIVAHDRPKRSRIVQKKELSDKAKSHKSNPNKSYKERDFVIRRILKTYDDAKTLIKESQEKSGSAHRYAEYTMEEWERREHTRMMKSGKIVTVSATHCKRHLPLSEKEIHIKL